MIISNNQKMNKIIKEYVFDKNNLNLIEKMKNLHKENVIKIFRLFVYLDFFSNRFVNIEV